MNMPHLDAEVSDTTYEQLDLPERLRPGVAVALWLGANDALTSVRSWLGDTQKGGPPLRSSTS